MHNVNEMMNSDARLRSYLTGPDVSLNRMYLLRNFAQTEHQDGRRSSPLMPSAFCDKHRMEKSIRRLRAPGLSHPHWIIQSAELGALE